MSRQAKTLRTNSTKVFSFSLSLSFRLRVKEILQSRKLFPTVSGIVNLFLEITFSEAEQSRLQRLHSYPDHWHLWICTKRPAQTQSCQALRHRTRWDKEETYLRSCLARVLACVFARVLARVLAHVLARWTRCLTGLKLT